MSPPPDQLLVADFEADYFGVDEQEPRFAAVRIPAMGSRSGYDAEAATMSDLTSERVRVFGLVEPVLFDTVIRFLREALRAIALIGVVLAAGAFLTGPSVTANAVRRRPD